MAKQDENNKHNITVNLAGYDNSWFDPGGSQMKRVAWYCINALFFDSYLFPMSALKCHLLRVFGATIGNNVTIKPKVKIKYPWNLSVGANVWIGEGVWIDCLAKVDVGDNVCISQESYLLTGNHDYKDINFGLVLGSIKIEDGSWLGARSITCPGVVVSRNAVITAGSVLQKNAEENGIYRGNPAELIRSRRFSVQGSDNSV